MKGANPAGNSPEGISSAWEKSLGSTCAPAVGDGLEHPHLGQRKLPREPVVQLFSRQLRTPAVLQHGCPKSNNFTTRRCRISMIQNPMAPRSGGASSRRFSPRQLRTPAVLQLGGLQSNSATIRRCCIPVVQNPMTPRFGCPKTILQFGGAAFRVCNPIVRAPAAAAANFPLMPGRQPKRRGAQQGTSQKKSKSYSI